MSKKDIKKLVRITPRQDGKLSFLKDELEMSENDIFKLALNNLFKDYKN